MENLPFIHHKQTIKHNPPHQNGDCMRTCVASLLCKPTVEEVPHFAEGLTFKPEYSDVEGAACINRMRAYLKEQGYVLFSVTLVGDWDVVKEYLSFQIDVPIMLSGTSVRGTNHSVIYYNGETYDSHPDNGGLVGPMTTGVYAAEVLVKVQR